MTFLWRLYAFLSLVSFIIFFLSLIFLFHLEETECAFLLLYSAWNSLYTCTWWIGVFQQFWKTHGLFLFKLLYSILSFSLGLQSNRHLLSSHWTSVSSVLFYTFHLFLPLCYITENFLQFFNSLSCHVVWRQACLLSFKILITIFFMLCESYLAFFFLQIFSNVFIILNITIFL